MTPGDLVLWIEGWNAAHSTEVEAPSADQYADLVRTYG